MLNPDPRQVRKAGQLAMRQRTGDFANGRWFHAELYRQAFEGRYFAGQLFRSSASVAANYRAACRSRSKREFVAKIGLVIEEADEALFWLETAVEIDLLARESAATLIQEANELIAIFVATRCTALRPKTST